LKKYKQYLFDDSIKVPTSTRYYQLKKHKQQLKKQTENQLEHASPKSTEHLMTHNTNLNSLEEVPIDVSLDNHNLLAACGPFSSPLSTHQPIILEEDQVVSIILIFIEYFVTTSSL
jgi:hypothetical protein